MAYTARTVHPLSFKSPPHLLIVEASFHADISDHLLQGAVDMLRRYGASYDRIGVPGSLEIPPAIRLCHTATARRYDGFIALGCVIRGDTYHFEIVCNDSNRGLMDLAVREGLLIGNGILTCENRDQALIRARPVPDGQDKGGDAAYAALTLISIRDKPPLSAAG